ncbi:hypothetical protein FRB96_007737 [Tulasnella sp. 330]|nr:hypothetical protein FRB96_007737 [Tulasnella sp. 330]KAG8874259.1 hypothetical protein FRB97_006056 [Tulasnella sp. 331]
MAPAGSITAPPKVDISHFPNPQGLKSTTWAAPDLSGKSTLGEIFQHHGTHSSSHKWVVWEDQTVLGDDKRGTLTYANWWRGLQRAAKFVKDQLDLKPGASGPMVIGIFANIDSLTYAILLEAIVYLGHTAFPISTRNSVAAIAHLLKETGCTQLIVFGGEPITNAVNQVRDELRGQRSGAEVLHVHEAPTFEKFFPIYGPSGKDDEDVEDVAPLRKSSTKEHALIIHSSGSTSFPKPIRKSHKVCVQMFALPWYGEGDVCGRINGAFSLPPFHIMGVFGLMYGPLGSGLISSVFKPYGPPIAPSPDAVLHGLRATKSDMTLVVPTFLEMWSDDEEAVKYLATLKSVMYGGGPLPEHAGNKLVSQGVKLLSQYGGTEIGVPCVWGIPKDYNGQFAWMAFSKQVHRRLIPQEPLGGEKDTYELVMVANERYTPAVLNVAGKAEFETHDLVVLHPDNQDLFKIIGRVDDQIMLVTGEKTNPGPIEHIIVSSPLVQHAMMFGRAKTQNGIIVQPSEGHEIDPTDEGQLAEFRSAIWEKVEEANEFAPQHSRLFKEMILVTSPGKPFPLTPKQTVVRKSALVLYESEIAACYAAVESASNMGSDVDTPVNWSQGETLIFVKKLVQKVLEREYIPSDDEDLFQNGLDSLRATYLRNSITVALRSHEQGIRLPSNFVFQNPTIGSLSQAVFYLVSSSASGDSGPTLEQLVSSRVHAMEEAVKKYTADLPVHKADESYPAPKAHEEVVVITGTTGGLGSHFLAQLIAMPSVKKVYALNRSSRTPITERQITSLYERLGCGTEAFQVLQSPKLQLVEATLEQDDMGIWPDIYEEIRTTATLIIHNSWRLDFNLSLASFKPQLDSVSTLVHLALRSPHVTPPRILFTSSIATVASWASPGPVPETPLDLHNSVGNGYGESKAVSAKVLEIVAAQTPVKSTTFRIGQLSGSSGTGAWATSDWVPLIIRGSQEVGAVPDGEGPVAWLAIDEAASAILEARNSSSPVLNIVHPHTMPWSYIMRSVSSLLNLPLVPFSKWVGKLDDAAKDPNALKSNPALALLDFYKQMSLSFAHDKAEASAKGVCREAGGLAMLDVKKATAESRSLNDAPALTEEDVGKWIRYFKAKGFVQ